MSARPKQTAYDWIDAHRSELSDWHQEIWNLAEPAWREYRSAAWYIARLRAEGFEVEEGTAGMPTAFRATWSNGPGPTVAAYAEYDAVPGNCQAAVARPEPRAGLDRHAAGHTDPHSALGIGALGGVLAAKAAMVEGAIGGRIRFFGEPAEKCQGSKTWHARGGFYDDLDAAISFHPAYMLPLFNTVRWDTHCGAYWTKVFTFTCDEPETWTAAVASPIPEAHATPRAPGAIDAVVLMYQTARTLRDSTLPHSGSWSISETILTAGQSTADNLAPDIGQIQYAWRVPTVAMAEAMDASLENIAQHVAQMTHCSLETTWVAKSRPGIPNHAMAELCWDNLRSAGGPRLGPEAVEFANEIRTYLGLEPVANPFLDEVSDLIDPREAERLLRRSLPEWQTNWTSDDYVEYTWHCPTVRLYVGRPMLRGGPYPAWVMNALGGRRSCIDPLIETAARTISGTMLDLFTDAEVLTAARAEYLERSNGGIGAPGWLGPLNPDTSPPVDLRWPEYVETARGREWWIPTRVLATDDSG